MPRPRKDDPGPSAQERLREAFWEVLSEKPYAKMTVGDVAARAKVNRNSLYYHYVCLDDLATECVVAELPFEVPRLLLGDAFPDPTLVRATVLSAANDRTLMRMRLVAGPQGSGSLAGMLKEAIRSFWLDMFGLRREGCTDEVMMLTSFVSGGFVELLGSVSPALTIEHVASFLAREPLRSVARSLGQALAAAAARQPV